jgi:hypothetical protein
MVKQIAVDENLIKGEIFPSQQGFYQRDEMIYGPIRLLEMVVPVLTFRLDTWLRGFTRGIYRRLGSAR